MLAAPMPCRLLWLSDALGAGGLLPRTDISCLAPSTLAGHAPRAPVWSALCCTNDWYWAPCGPGRVEHVRVSLGKQLVGQTHPKSGEQVLGEQHTVLACINSDPVSSPEGIAT